MDALLSQNKNQQQQCPPANDDAERPKTEVCRLSLARVRMLTQLQQQDFSLQCLQPVRRGGNASPRVQLRPTAEGSVVASSQSASHWRGVPRDCAVTVAVRCLPWLVAVGHWAATSCQEEKPAIGRRSVQAHCPFMQWQTAADRGIVPEGDVS